MEGSSRLTAMTAETPGSRSIRTPRPRRREPVSALQASRREGSAASLRPGLPLPSTPAGPRRAGAARRPRRGERRGARVRCADRQRQRRRIGPGSGSRGRRARQPAASRARLGRPGGAAAQRGQAPARRRTGCAPARTDRHDHGLARPAGDHQRGRHEPQLRTAERARTHASDRGVLERVDRAQQDRGNRARDERLGQRHGLSGAARPRPPAEGGGGARPGSGRRPLPGAGRDHCARAPPAPGGPARAAHAHTGQDPSRAGGGVTGWWPADADIALLDQALRPSDQASGFFAAISALLGFLFAFNAMLLTVPERRQAIAELRLIGTKRIAIVQIVVFQALCLGITASLVGLLGGYALSLGVFHQSSGYLAEAFTLGTNTIVGTTPLLLSLLGGILATFLASAVPLLDMRSGRAMDAVYFEDGSPGNTLSGRTQRRLGLAALGLLALTSVLYASRPSLALMASGVLALATVLAVPLVFAGILRAGAWVAGHYQMLTSLQVSLTSLKAATLRSLALAATGAVAIFGGIALGGSRDDLLRGIDGFAHSYAADAQLWVANPEDNQATVTFAADDYARRIAAVPGVAHVRAFQGGFLEFGDRRTWLIARPAGANSSVLRSQTIHGGRPSAVTRLGEGGWIAVSEQIAEQHHVKPGDALTLPTPSGQARFRLAATTTNLAWSPGVIFMGTRDYSRLWETREPTALGVELLPGTSLTRARWAIARHLGP